MKSVELFQKYQSNAITAEELQAATKALEEYESEEENERDNFDDSASLASSNRKRKEREEEESESNMGGERGKVSSRSPNVYEVELISITVRPMSHLQRRFRVCCEGGPKQVPEVPRRSQGVLLEQHVAHRGCQTTAKDGQGQRGGEDWREEGGRGEEGVCQGTCPPQE